MEKAGDYMPGGAEIIRDTVNEFQKVQTHMKNAREENAMKTYEGLKKEDYGIYIQFVMVYP